MVYNKLVRDRIPEIIEAGGSRPVTHILDTDRYRAALLDKLVEEAEEARQAPDEALSAELADVLEVLQCLLAEVGMTWEVLQAHAADKRAQRGSFSRRLLLEYVDE
jgi:predicted house-cleaning noncanonical NTP pyrophosphatase (MazG superfamily)